MSVFLESPWPALTLGFVVEAILVVALIRTGRGAIVGLMVVAAALVAALVGLERSVVTEREAVADTLDAVAAACEANDPLKVAAYFTQGASQLRQVQSILSRVSVRDAKVGSDLEIEIDPQSPGVAVTRFTAVATVHDKQGQIPYEKALRRLTVTLWRNGQRWLIHDFVDGDTGAPFPGGGS